MRWIELLAMAVVLGGCANPSAILKSDGPTMRELLEGGRRTDTDNPARRVEVLSAESWQGSSIERYTRDASNETTQLFPRLPNPEIAIYVYPHLATERRMPVPGYTTAMPLYERYEYALPGEGK